jgi:hypothetical protein
MSEIYAVFNELAVSPIYRNGSWSKYDANEWLKQFSLLLHKAAQKNVSGLRTYSHPHQIELIKGYTLLEWFSDSQFDLELRLLLQTKFAELSRILEFPENQQGNPLIQYLHNNKDAYGLGAAHLMESLAISLNTGNKRWRKNLLDIKIMEMVEDEADLVEYDETVRHMCEESHLQSHEKWIAERLKTIVRNGKELLKKAQEWYPNLLFCKDAEAQLKQLPGNTPEFRRIITRLFELERYCQQWEHGGFEVNAIPNASNESDSTMQQYGRLRMFICPDGQSRSFGFHLKGIPGHWRIHIWPDVEGVFRESSDSRRKILIGYIGRHLPTSTG